MRRFKYLWLFILGVPCLSFTSKESNSFFTLTAFELDIRESDQMLVITNRFSSSTTDTSATVDLYWRIIIDGKDIFLNHVRMNKMQILTNKEIGIKPSIELYKLGEDNEVTLRICPSDAQEYTKRAKVNIKGKTSVTFSEKDNGVGVSSGYLVENMSLYDETKNYSKEDRVIFSNYEDLVVEDYYLNFDIRRFKYSYVGNKEILEGDFYFLIYDKYNLFKDLPLYKDSQYRYIELKPVIINGDSMFSFKENIYYDPISHNTSLTYKDGYKVTDKLYFPSGKLDTLKSIHCMLNFNIKGYTNFNMSSEFDIYFLRNYFGDCIDSEYCVEMNSDNGSNIREKVVDVIL